MTLQEQYNLIKKGKGHKGIFLTEAKKLFPNMLTNPMGFDEATNILKTRGVISENYVDLKPITQIGASPKTEWENKFAQFLAEETKKPEKEVEETQSHNFDYKDKSNLDNQIGQEVLNGIYFEAKENPDKPLDELRKIVAKNLEKDGQYYIKNAAFGIKELGYKQEETMEVSGKYKSSGYSDKLQKMVKESLIKEGLNNPLEKTAEGLAKAIYNWYDWYTERIDDGAQRRKAERLNASIIDWFHSHSPELQDAANAILQDKVGETISENSSFEDKMARLRALKDKQRMGQGPNIKVDNKKQRGYSDKLQKMVKESLIKETSSNSFDEDDIFILWDEVVGVEDDRKGISHTNFFGEKSQGHTFMFDEDSPNFEEFVAAVKQKLDQMGLNYKWAGDETLVIYAPVLKEESFEDKMARLRALKDKQRMGQGPNIKADNKKQRLQQKLNMLKRAYMELISDMEKESDTMFAMSGDWYQEQLDDMENAISDIESKINQIGESVVNESKSSKPSLDSDLAEIDTQANIVAMEAKLDKISEMISTKMERLGMIEEDANLAELVDKGKMKAMQKEIKILEKRKAKMEKIYEKMAGKGYTKEIVDETAE